MMHSGSATSILNFVRVNFSRKKKSQFVDQKVYTPPTMGASPDLLRRRATVHHQTALLKRILGAQRATGA